jgi:uncharacterized protein YjbI with pentapeptide repeats
MLTIPSGEQTVRIGVQASNSKGLSRPSSKIKVTVPGKPNGVSASGVHEAIAVSWTAPDADGGALITGYTVTATPGLGSCTTTGATTCVVTGLTDGKRYSVSVRATNLMGSGRASAKVKATPSTAQNCSYIGPWANLGGYSLNNADLTNANLNNADLTGAYLLLADLSGANLTNADLSGAMMKAASLSSANLTGANLSWAFLLLGNLTGANLTNANLSNTYLEGANMNTADLTEANLNTATLTEADLNTATLTYVRSGGGSSGPRVRFDQAGNSSTAFLSGPKPS